MKLAISSIVLASSLCLFTSASAYADSFKVEITFTNLSQGAVLTPPVFATSKYGLNIFKVGKKASLALEHLAEGGDTARLRESFRNTNGFQEMVQTDEPIAPGKSVTVTLQANHRSRLSLASMVLPTNDGFVAVNGRRIGRWYKSSFYLKAYDAGTEDNDELCESIPGPCGGTGFSEDDNDIHIAPHPGIHGEGELSRKMHNWGNPIAKVTVRRVYR